MFLFFSVFLFSLPCMNTSYLPPYYLSASSSGCAVVCFATHFCLGLSMCLCVPACVPLCCFVFFSFATCSGPWLYRTACLHTVSSKSSLSESSVYRLSPQTSRSPLSQAPAHPPSPPPIAQGPVSPPPIHSLQTLSPCRQHST